MRRVSMNEAAALCGVARSTIQRAVHQGRIPRGDDKLISTVDLVRAGYLTEGHEDDVPPPRTRVTLLMLYELNLTILTVLRELSAQLSRLLLLLEPDAGQPAARQKKRPPGPTMQPC